MQKQDTLKNLLIAAGVFMIIMAVAPRLLPTPPTPSTGSEAPTPTDTTNAAASDATVNTATVRTNTVSKPPQAPDVAAPLSTP